MIIRVILDLKTLLETQACRLLTCRLLVLPTFYALKKLLYHYVLSSQRVKSVKQCGLLYPYKNILQQCVNCDTPSEA